MSYEKYIDKLMSNENEIEEGLLFELEEKPPKELHSNMMKTIDIKSKKGIYKKYQRFISTVAAALIFAVLLRGFTILNPPKNGKIATKESIENYGNNKGNDNNKNDGDTEKTVSEVKGLKDDKTSLCPIYEISIKKGNESIINYIKENSSISDEKNNIYKMSTDSFKILQKNLKDESIGITTVNEPLEKDGFVTIKLILKAE